MRDNTENNRRTFVLTTARVYIPGSLPEEASETAVKGIASGCCDSGPAPSQEGSAGHGTSSCCAGSTAQQSNSCC